MGSVILSDVMDELGARLKAIDGLNVYEYPADRPTVPAATIDYPDEIEYTRTYGGTDGQTVTRGIDAIELTVRVIEQRNPDRVKRIAKYLDGSGPTSVREVLEDHDYQSLGSVLVDRANVEFGEYNGTPCIIARFTLQIEGGN